MWEIESDQVVMTKARMAGEAFIGNFECFTEWESDADCKAFDHR